MGNSPGKIFAAVLLLSTLGSSRHPTAAAAQQGAAGHGKTADAGSDNVVPNKISGYTAWDDVYFYVAVQVTKPNLTGANKDPFTDPLADDDVVVSIQTDNDHKSTARTAHTVTVAVSEAGGTQLYSGVNAAPLFKGLGDIQTQLADIEKNEKDPNLQQQRRVALLASIPKIQVTQVGAPRAGAGNYPGYTVEVAVPWADLGGQPDAGARMGFNIAAISKSIGSPRVQSLATSVHGLSDVDNPSLWDELTFAGEAKVAAGNELTSPRVITNKPVIDGTIAENEWNHLAEFSFGERVTAVAAHASLAATIAARTRPDFAALPPKPVVVSADSHSSPEPLKAHTPYRLDRLVFAQYEYGYQGDPRKDVPTQMVSNADHSSALAHHPLDGTGPWFSYDHANWHRGQLSEMRKDGVDIVLPVFRADPAHRRAYADKGLVVLAAALTYLRRNGFDYPQVGLYLDSSSLVQINGDKLNMSEPAAQNLVYGAIRDFYLRVPAEFRCRIALDPSERASSAYPVFLSDGASFRGWDPSVSRAIRARFMADFDGADLVLIGQANSGANTGLDGNVTSPHSDAAQAGGWIKTIGIHAGYDTDAARAFTPNAGTLPSRRDGDTYRSEWTAAIPKNPDWILLENWNDYSLGGEVAPSLEAGYGTSDLTRIFARLFNGSDKKLRAKFLSNDAPREVVGGSKFTVQTRVQNAGMESWGSLVGQQTVGLAYRWLKGGQAVSGRSAMVPLGNMLSGSELSVPVKVDTMANGSALAPGDYTLEIVAAFGKGGTFDSSLQPGNAMLIPVTISASKSAGVVTVIDTDMPLMMEAGGVYPITARLRNDGSSVWTRAEGYRVTARLYRITEGAEGNVETPVESADASVVLQKDTAPGEETEVHLLLPVIDPQGKPLPTWSSEAPFCYAVRWEVAAEHAGPVPAAVQEGNLPRVAGLVSSLRVVTICDFDFGVRFMQDGTLPTLPGERRQPIVLSIKNFGPQTWKRESVRVGYHWYYQDGSEFLWEDETTALPHDVPPGEGVSNLLAFVTPPPCDGNYFLVWDVKFGDTWASTSEVSRVLGEEIHPVQVIGGKLTFADLTKAYNLDGVTDLTDTKGGDFDGKGRTFPAALIPPFTDDGVVPAGIWQPYARTGPESARHISFKWGSKEPRSNNFIVCRGQRVELAKFTGKCRVVHMVAASVNANVVTNIKLVFQEPTGESEDLYALSVSRWDEPPVNGEDAVFTSKWVHSASGAAEGTVSLYHYSFVIKDPRRIIAVKLPNEPNIRIAAITLEQ